MERNEINRKVIHSIKAILGDSKLDNNFVFSEDVKLFQTGLNFSSIDIVMLIVKLEVVFNIRWPDEYLALNEELTIGKVIDVIQQCISQGENNL